MILCRLLFLPISVTTRIHALGQAGRRIARVRGKARHHCRAIPLVAVAAPSLAQPMHCRETGTGPVDVSAMDDETKMELDWDRELPVSDRAQQALEFMRVAIEKYANAGQPPCRWRRARCTGAPLRWRSTPTPVSPCGRWRRVCCTDPSWRVTRGTLGSS